MPKVSHHEFRIDGELIKLDIGYNKEKMFHIMRFPSKVFQSLDAQEMGTIAGIPTEKELIKSVEEIIDRYHRVVKSKRKIIAYSMSATTEIRMNKVGDGSYQGTKSWAENLHDLEGFGNNGYGFVIDYKVLVEINDNGLKYSKLLMNGETTNPTHSSHHNLHKYTMIVTGKPL